MIIYDKIPEDDKIYSNAELIALKGTLDPDKAKITFIDFLYNNLGIATQILTGIKLFPFQEIILREWFDHNFSINVWSRGGSKSFLASLFCCLYPLFNPGRKIVLASNVFRSTRRIINQIERIIEAKKAKLLKQCFPLDGAKIKIDRRQDEWCVHINEGFIKALPLNEKIRGERADVLIIDEGLLIPEQIYRDVLLPFLTARTDISKNLELKEVEDALIASGALSEENRILLESDKKIIILSSASYDFQFICKLYNEWVDQITGTNKPQVISKKYFISRLSYKSLPNELIDKDITDLAKGSGEQTASFQREFMARFVSGSDGFFNIKKLHANTVIDGDLPCVQIRGNKESKYILAIDPSFAAGLSSDWFGFGLYLLNSETRSITQVNSYGIAGGELNQHLTYLAYLLQNFNIVLVIADLAGENNSFINSANESVIFQERGLKLDFFDGDFEGENYVEEIRKAQNSYNISLGKICYRQVFSSQWLRIANEHLKTQIDCDKIHFCSHMTANNTILEKVLNQPMPVVIKDTLKNKVMDIVDFIEWQDFLIDETKKELALIEVKATVIGTLQFDLPSALKKLTGAERPRKDLYSCLLMGSWGAKCYFDMMYSDKELEIESFSPIAIK